MWVMNLLAFTEKVKWSGLSFSHVLNVSAEGR
jgi:hypothetical protein